MKEASGVTLSKVGVRRGLGQWTGRCRVGAGFGEQVGQKIRNNGGAGGIFIVTRCGMCGVRINREGEERRNKTR